MCNVYVHVISVIFITMLLFCNNFHQGCSFHIYIDILIIVVYHIIINVGVQHSNYLNTVVTSIRDIEDSILIHCYCTRMFELSWSISLATKWHKKCSFMSEHWNTMITILNHVHCVVTVDTDTCRTEQFPTTIALLSKLLQEVSFWIENLNTMVIGISHIHISCTVKCYIMGVMKLPSATALATNTIVECQVWTKNLNTMVWVICYYNFLACRGNS